MAFKIPDVLRYEIRHRLENLRGGATDGTLRGWINAHPVLIAGVAGLSATVMALVLVLALRPVPGPSRMQGKTAWFCDVNTGKLFQGSPKKVGPIQAPSGPAPNGEPAGFRAHVYSYALDPNETELFVGFLERPDPEARRKYATADVRDIDRWTQGRLIRRPDDKQWVRASSPEGQAILQELMRPNKKGQTPIYQAPREKGARE
jgi:hypothetical protein